MCFAHYSIRARIADANTRPVSWQWSGGRPGGEAVEVKEGDVSVTSKKGNEITKHGEPGNPAVHISRSGNDVVKKASELDVDEAGDKHKEGGGDEKKDEEEEKKDEEEQNGDAKTGEKRKAEEEEEKEEEGDAKKKGGKKGAAASKKQKKDASAEEPKENGEKADAKKKQGRPAKANGSAAKETKKKEPKKAATADGQPRRSGRNASRSE